MSIAPTSAEGSAAAWAAEAAGAAEAYVEAQADEAARLRSLEEKRQAELAASGSGRTDGVDPPPPPLPAHQSFWANDPNRPGATPANASTANGSSAASGSGSTGAGGLYPDGNGGYIYIPPQDDINIVQPPEAPDFILPIGNFGGNSSPVQPPPTPSPPPPDPQAAPNGANEVNKPDDPEKPKEAPKIVSGLGEEVDKILNASPTLKRQWEALKEQKWQLVTRRGGGSEAHPGDKLLVIDLDQAKGDPLKLAVLMSHEVGHAAAGFDPPLDPKNMSREEYVARSVDQDLRHEGRAAFENARHREEILRNGGPDIGIAGKHDENYLIIYDSYKIGNLTEAEAKQYMGEAFAIERRSTDGKTYAAGLADDYRQRWEAAHAPTN